MDFHSALLKPESSHPEILAPPPTSLPRFPNASQEGPGPTSGSDRDGPCPGARGASHPGPRLAPLPSRGGPLAHPVARCPDLALFLSSSQTWRGL